LLLLILAGRHLAYDHVATIASSPLQEAAGGGIVLYRCDDLDEVRAYGKQGVLQAELADARVDMARFDGKYLAQLIDHRSELLGDETDLAQMHCHVSLGFFETGTGPIAATRSTSSVLPLRLALLDEGVHPFREVLGLAQFGDDRSAVEQGRLELFQIIHAVEDPF